LTTAKVRPARLHDARHTAATVLMVILRVPVRAAMDIMGWSEASMATRYSHMPDELRHEYAGQVGGLLWAAEEVADGQLGNDHRDALQQLAATLPEPWRTRVTELLRPDDDDGLRGALVPA
ncbi:MAG TPA: hypothetical protein VK735_21805, partial [Pseudonocardia sp.]|uniref:hypothetical protein n=1 Tax=Pseudonocardia sp. TaxID=60912 RepID=UPI002C1B0CBB